MFADQTLVKSVKGLAYLGPFQDSVFPTSLSCSFSLL